MNMIPKYIIGTFVILLTLWFDNNRVYAQSNDEIWPEVDGIYTFNKKFRVISRVSFTKRESQYSDGNFALLFDYFTLPFLKKLRSAKDTTSGYYQWLRIGYTYGKSTSSADDPFTESVLRLESNTRFHLPYHVLATVKNRFDLRFYNKELKERYRPRVTFERDFKTTYMTFTMYAFSEYFFNFSKTTDNRLRWCLGAEIWVSKLISTEFYFLKQYENTAGAASTNAVGTILKFNMASRKKQHAIETKQEEQIRDN